MSQPWSGVPVEPEQTSWSENEPPAPPGRALTTQWWFWAGLAAVVVAAALGGFFVGRTGSGESSVDALVSQARLKDAYDACKSRDTDDTLELTDNGATIVVDTRSEYGSTFGMDCVLTQLETSESIKAEMGRTTALQGVQDAESDGVAYSWSYHPDNGVDMVITMASGGGN